MAGLSGMLTSTVISMLTSTADGVNVRVEAIENADSTIQTIGIRTIIAQNASVDISEKTGHAHYPAVLVYCDKVSNTLREKFRQFSGKAHMVVEVRHSQDQAAYVDAVCALLDDSRGDWGGGAIYGGGYEVSYEAVGRGGKNFLQRAKVGFDVEVSK
jgi:hypothetical protein